MAQYKKPDMLRLLLVEDDDDLRENYVRFLEEQGYEVLAVANAEAALERFRDERYDLLVVDLLLPGIDGAEFCRMVRADEERGRVPVVMLTAMAGPLGFQLTDADATWAPIDRFVEKGLTLEPLAEAITELLSQKPA